MKELRITTGRLGSDITPMKQGGYVNVAVTQWGKLEDGSYGNKTMWVTVYLTDAQVKYCTEKEIGKGTAVALGGRFDYGMATGKDGKQYLTISVNPFYLVKAIGGLGGICTASIDNARLTEDIIINENGTGRVQAAYDAWVGGKNETRWITLFMSESLVKRAQGLKLKKGSHLDLEGEINITQNSYNGKEYINASLSVGTMGYAANSGKKADENATTSGPAAPAAPAPSTPATSTSTATAPAPEVPADDFGFSQVDENEEFF